MSFLERKKRCKWCNINNPIYVTYHDYEWGVPLHDDTRLFEMLLLECFQAGLSWECVLNKREAFRQAFSNFDYNSIAIYDSKKIEELLNNHDIIRNRRKIEAAVTNAKTYINIRKEFGSFNNFIRQITGEEIIYECSLTFSSTSTQLSKELRKRGMKQIGTTTAYSFLQAIGAINSHERCCFLFQGHTMKQNRNS